MAPTRTVGHAPCRENRVSRKRWWPHGTCQRATLWPHCSSEFKNTPYGCHLGARKQLPLPHQPLHSQGLRNDPWDAATRTWFISTTLLGAKKPEGAPAVANTSHGDIDLQRKPICTWVPIASEL